MGAFTLGVTERQLRQSSLEQFSGLTAYSLLMQAVAVSTTSDTLTRLERQILSALQPSQRAALEVLMYRDGSYCPSSAIPEHLHGSLGRSGLDRIASADTSSLAARLEFLYPEGLPEHWNRILDDPARWTTELAGAYASTQDLFLDVWRHCQPRLTVEKVRFEVAMEAGLGLGDFVAGCPPYRIDGAAISMPWGKDVSKSFDGRLTFAPLLSRGAATLLLMRDDGAVREHHATVAYGIGAARAISRPPTEVPRLQILIGPARSAILLATARAVPIGELGSRLVYSPATMTYHVGILETSGLVSTERRDGRVWVTRTVRGDLLLETLS